jgi:hypothetical protein
MQFGEIIFAPCETQSTYTQWQKAELHEGTAGGGGGAGGAGGAMLYSHYLVTIMKPM